ncbi:endonuclease III [Candidatus Woesearchaeota archaeon CG10_big_fil_rev_8_21_14_0_10_37_12]|nr:MAG: endonuclease III [Candidatus Woesearchaeota archaeon CG10_big_fil_rev_8_21_14_0_10_37_12]
MPTHNQIDTVLSTLAKTQGSNTMLGRMGKKYEPFKVLISTILSARAKDETTEVIAEKLFEKYPTVEKLANAKQKEVIEIIRKIGFFNNKSKNIINAAKMLIEKFDGEVPDNLEKLIELPGVGRKVANCVLVYSFGKDAIPVDIHVHRISNRLGWVKTKTPEETEQKLMKLVPQKHWQIVNDTFVTHGKTTCLPISPKCSECPIYNHCKRTGVTSKR